MRGLDLGARADDAGIGHQALDLRRAEARDRVRIKAGKGGAERLPLPEDRDPGEPGLEALQHQRLPEHPGIAHGHAPFRVVIGPVERIGADPGATLRRGHGAGAGWDAPQGDGRLRMDGGSEAGTNGSNGPTLTRPMEKRPDSSLVQIIST